ncbi:MAG: DL-endopeptidase inhibitor IseA family protein [Bacilli bacterium]
MRKLILCVTLLFSIFATVISASSEITVDYAKKHVVAASLNYWEIYSGPTKKPNQFKKDGNYYNYLPDHINTLTKFQKKLEQYYSKDTAKQFISSMDLKSKQKRLYRIAADGGSLLDWEKAVVKKVRETKDSAQFSFSVPVGETGQSKKYSITFVKEHGKWVVRDWIDF